MIIWFHAMHGNSFLRIKSWNKCGPKIHAKFEKSSRFFFEASKNKQRGGIRCTTWRGGFCQYKLWNRTTFILFLLSSFCASDVLQMSVYLWFLSFFHHYPGLLKMQMHSLWMIFKILSRFAYTIDFFFWLV